MQLFSLLVSFGIDLLSAAFREAFLRLFVIDDFLFNISLQCSKFSHLFLYEISFFFKFKCFGLLFFQLTFDGFSLMVLLVFELFNFILVLLFLELDLLSKVLLILSFDGFILLLYF